MNSSAIDRVISVTPSTPLPPAVVASHVPRVPDALLKGVAVTEAGGGQAAADASLQKAAKRMEDYARSVGRSLQFRVDQDSGKVVVSVRDPSTGELIRQIPTEAALKIAENLRSDDPCTSSLIIDGQA